MGLKEGNISIYVGNGPTIKTLKDICEKYKAMTGKKLSMSKAVSSILRLYLVQNSVPKIIANITDSNN